MTQGPFQFSRAPCLPEAIGLVTQGPFQFSRRRVSINGPGSKELDGKKTYTIMDVATPGIQRKLRDSIRCHRDPRSEIYLAGLVAEQICRESINLPINGN